MDSISKIGHLREAGTRGLYVIVSVLLVISVSVVMVARWGSGSVSPREARYQSSKGRATVTGQVLSGVAS
jgi:hypothetical protein